MLASCYGNLPFSQSVGISDYLKKQGANSSVYIIGSEPQILFYAGLKTPTRFFYFYPLIYPSTLREAFRAEVTDDLRNNMPDVLIYVNHPSSHFISTFPTILELFGFSPAETKDTHYVTLFDRVPERLGFTSGAVFGRFNKPPKWTPLPEDITRCCDEN